MRKTNKKYVMLFLCCSLLLGSMTGCNSHDKKDSEVSSEETAVEEKKDFNEDTDSNLGAWGRAMGSVLISMNEGDPYYFGGYQVSEGNQKAAAGILEQSWQIHNRKELLTQIKMLTDTGYRTEYLKESKEMRSMSKKQLKIAMKQFAGSVKIHYEMIQYNWDTWKKKGLVAWDMCRVSHLAQWGYVAGYLNVREAQAVIQPAAELLQKNFKSWDEVQTNWLDGYALYASVDLSKAGNDYEKRKAIYEQLKTAQAEEGMLYDDTMFQNPILPLADTSYQTLWMELEEDTEEKGDNTK